MRRIWTRWVGQAALLAVILTGPGLEPAAADCPPLSLAPAALPQGSVGEPYLQKIPVYGGTPPVMLVISGGALPAGIKLEPDGKLLGTPKDAGEYSLTVTASDSCRPTQTAGQSYQLLVLDKGVASETPTSLLPKKTLAVQVTPSPAAVGLAAGASSIQVSYAFVAKPQETAILKSPGISYQINGAVVESVVMPLAVTLVNGVGEVKETIAVPSRVLEAARREKGAKILQSRAFVGRGTTALAVVEIALEAPAR
jgi:putative Ig domain-containing protein